MSAARLVLNPGGTVTATRLNGRYRSPLDELLDLLDARPAWHADAACREHPEVHFFPTQGEPTGPARAVCEGCLVREECLAYAMERRDTQGIWGGSSEHQRKQWRGGLRR